MTIEERLEKTVRQILEMGSHPRRIQLCKDPNSHMCRGQNGCHLARELKDYHQKQSMHEFGEKCNRIFGEATDGCTFQKEVQEIGTQILTEKRAAEEGQSKNG